MDAILGPWYRRRSVVADVSSTGSQADSARFSSSTQLCGDRSEQLTRRTEPGMLLSICLTRISVLLVSGPSSLNDRRVQLAQERGVHDRRRSPPVSILMVLSESLDREDLPLVARAGKRMLVRRRGLVLGVHRVSGTHLYRALQRTQGEPIRRAMLRTGKPERRLSYWGCSTMLSSRTEQPSTVAHWTAVGCRVR